MFAVINSATGEAVSFGSVVADPLPSGLEAIAIDHQPGTGERWDSDTRSVVSIPAPPDRGAFLRSFIPLLGGGTSPEQLATGAQRMYTIDRDYPGFDRALREAAWDIALAGLTAMLLDEVITEQEHEDILGAWAAAHLPVPEA